MNLIPWRRRLEAGKIDATYKQGVLTIEVPKLEKTPTARISVHAG